MAHKLEQLFNEHGSHKLRLTTADGQVKETPRWRSYRAVSVIRHHCGVHIGMTGYYTRTGNEEIHSIYCSTETGAKELASVLTCF